MAFGIKREEILRWKSEIDQGKISFLTHYWLDERFPEMRTVTKVGCKDLAKLKVWGLKYGISPEWIHIRKDGYSHFDLLGERQKEILKTEGLSQVLDKFR